MESAYEKLMAGTEKTPNPQRQPSIVPSLVFLGGAALFCGSAYAIDYLQKRREILKKRKSVIFQAEQIVFDEEFRRYVNGKGDQ
jgi:hypothetical protein